MLFSFEQLHNSLNNDIFHISRFSHKAHLYFYIQYFLRVFCVGYLDCVCKCFVEKRKKQKRQKENATKQFVFAFTLGIFVFWKWKKIALNDVYVCILITKIGFMSDFFWCFWSRMVFREYWIPKRSGLKTETKRNEMKWKELRYYVLFSCLFISIQR